LKLLSGNFDLTIDDKNRLLIPAELRRAFDPLAEGEFTSFYLVFGANGRPWLWCSKTYEAKAEGQSLSLTPTQEQIDTIHRLYGDTAKVELDRQGRVLVPEKVIKDFELPREVTLVGACDHLELWDRPSYLEYRRKLRGRQAAA
jgi:MraZ protein